MQWGKWLYFVRCYKCSSQFRICLSERPPESPLVPDAVDAAVELPGLCSEIECVTASGHGPVHLCPCRCPTVEACLQLAPILDHFRALTSGQ